MKYQLETINVIACLNGDDSSADVDMSEGAGIEGDQ